MTVFFDSENEVCAQVAKAFDFFADGNLEKLNDVLSGERVDFADDQIGFVISSDFGKSFCEMLEKITVHADYFFAIIATDNSFRSQKKFNAILENANIKLNYLNFVSTDESERKRADRAISFRSDVGLLVEKIHEIPLKTKFASFVSNIFGKKSQEESDETPSTEEK